MSFICNNTLMLAKQRNELKLRIGKKKITIKVTTVIYL